MRAGEAGEHGGADMAEAGGAAGEDHGSTSGGLGNREPSEVRQGFAGAPICYRGSPGSIHLFL